MFKKLISAALVVSSSLAFAGGIDGGGGGTLPAQPIKTSDVITAIQSSKRDLRLLFRSMQMSLAYEADPQNPLDQKLFHGTKTILDILETTAIEAPLDKPCYDSYETEVDGSSHASKPNTICISAFRIAPKLTTDQARIEISALIAHELSHLLGTTEQEAVLVQEWISVTLRGTGESEGESYLGAMIRGSSQFSSDIALSQPRTSDELVLVIEKLLKDLEFPLKTSAFSAFDKTTHDFFEYQMARLTLGYWYALSQSNRGDAKAWQEKYEAIFKGQKSIRFRDAGNPIYWPSNTLGDLQIKKIEMSWELMNLYESEFGVYFLGPIRSYLLGMYVSDGLTPLPEVKENLQFQLPANAWKNFLGQYKVINVKCTANGMDTTAMQAVQEFIIDKGQMTIPGRDPIEMPEGYYQMTENSAQSSSKKDLFVSTDKDSSGSVFVTGNTQNATRVAERGSSWANFWTRDVYSMQEDAGSYKILRDYQHQVWNIDSLPVLQTAHCEYALQKQ